MSYEILIQAICISYFFTLAVLGFWMGLDVIKDYKWPSPGFKFMATLLFVTAPIFMGIFPMIVIGVFAIASVHTGLQEKRKGRRK